MLNLSSEKLEEIIDGPTLALIPQKREHSREMYEILEDEGLYDFTGGYRAKSLAEYEERFLKLESRRSPDKKYYWLNWVVKAGDRLIGYVQATVGDGTAEVAWVIGILEQNRKYGRTAVILMIDWLKSVGCIEFRANIHRDNMKSRKLAEAVGFTRTDNQIDNEDVWILK